MNILLVQADMSWQSPAVNCERFEMLVAGAGKADLIVLPEMFATGFITEPTETLDREVNLAELKREADEYKAKLEQGIDISKDIKDAKLIDDIKQDMNDIQHLFENYQPKPVQLDSAITNNIESQTTITENMQSSHDSTTNITNNDYIETQINLSDSPNKIHEERNDTQSQHDATSHSASTSNQYDNFQQSLFKQRLDL